MNHLNINIISLERDWDIILWDIHTIINQTDRIALIWRNGIWKSTLMKIISWQLKDYTWSIENIWWITLGYLEQIHFSDDQKTIRNELKDAFKEIRNLEKIIEEEEKIMSETWEYIGYTDAIEKYKFIGGYTYENEVEKVSRGIWIFHLLDKTLSQISWGERTKIALAKILLSKPDFLLLDEPTNFIDLSSVEWLENYLEYTWKWWYLIVSHDREFLDKTCQTTIEVLWKNGIKTYHWDYTYSVEVREKELLIQDKKFEEQQTFLESEKVLINRFRAGSRAWFAKSREKALEKIDILKKPESKIEVHFIFTYDKYSPESLLKAEDVFIGRQDPLFYIRNIEISKWEKIWIVWENGVWKSTFIKTILRQIKPLEWYLHLHENTKILYFSQLHETLNLEKSIYDNFILHGLPYSRERIGSIISTYGFEFHDTTKKIENLSWGERSRLLFALLSQNSLAWKNDEFSENSNLLILDEPTNHLDAETRESLEKALRIYPWSIIFISHDRYFVNKLAEKIWIIEDGELIISYWNYEDYKYKRERWINLDMSLFNIDGELDLVLEEKLWVIEARRIKEKFARRRKK